MPLKIRWAKLFLSAFLALSSVMGGGLMDPKQIAEHLRMMNQTVVGVVIPEEKGGDPPEGIQIPRK